MNEIEKQMKLEFLLFQIKSRVIWVERHKNDSPKDIIDMTEREITNFEKQLIELI